MLRYRHDKSRVRFDGHWPHLFYAVIDCLSLREVHMTGRQYTWANSLPEPTYEKLDRVLMDSRWEDKYPLVTVRALERIEAFSDHAPIFLSTGTLIPPAKSQFKFELGWLLRDGFDDLVKKIWSQPVVGASAVQRWNNKMRNLRKFLRGWARHTTGMLKKEKERMCSIIDELDKLAEVRPLSANESDLKQHSNELVGHMLREEEVKWYQRSKAPIILHGDSNTRHFHNVANGRHRKKRIHSLHQD